MTITPIMFGRANRVTCDVDGCEERHTVMDGEWPVGWVEDPERGRDLCPEHAPLAAEETTP